MFVNRTFFEKRSS